ALPLLPRARCTPFPYTTLFRSVQRGQHAPALVAAREVREQVSVRPHSQFSELLGSLRAQRDGPRGQLVVEDVRHVRHRHAWPAGAAGLHMKSLLTPSGCLVPRVKLCSTPSPSVKNLTWSSTPPGGLGER